MLREEHHETELIVRLFSCGVGGDVEEKIRQAFRPIEAGIALRERLRLIEWALIHQALDITHGDSRTAARLLRIPYSSFMRRHKKFHRKSTKS